MPTDRNRFKTSDRLVEAMPKALGQRVPEPLHARLISLCDLVYDAGEARRPTKAELIAALILAAPEDPDVLIQMLREYGRANVGQALTGSGTAADIVRFDERTSGPRRGGPPR